MELGLDNKMEYNKITTRGILIFSILVFSFSFVSAVTGVIQNDYFYDLSTGNSLTYVQSLLYYCSDNACDSIGNQLYNLNSGSDNHIIFEYPYNPSSTISNVDNYAHYIFKEGYLPKEYVESIWGYGATLEYNYNFNKATSCHSPIDSFSVTNSNYVNEPVVINMQADLEADASSAFTNLELEYVPNGYEDYYSAETTVTLTIKNSLNNVVYTDSVTLNLLMDTSENVQFEWTPEYEDTYTATIVTDVIDNQCSSNFQETTSRIFTVWPARPLNQCYTIVNDLEADPETGDQGENVQFTFNKISNYVDSSGIKTPIPTAINYEIRDNSNNLIYSNDFTVEANGNDFDAEDVIFNWLASIGGYLNVKVMGVAQSSLCDGKTNPEDIAILGVQVDTSSETYNVVFTVEDSTTGELLEDVEITLGTQTGETDSQGEVDFNVNPNDYDYEISNTGYYTQTGSVNVNEDKNIIIELIPTTSPIETYNVVFIVEDSTTGELLENVEVILGTQAGETDFQGEIDFNVNPDDYSYEISKTGYYTQTGSVEVDEDKNIVIELVPIASPIENESITNVELLFPTGGETLSGNELILWNATNSRGELLLISIEYSINDGTTWVILTSNQPNDGEFLWNTEDYEDDEYILRVGATNQVRGGITYDVSGEFTIDNDDSDDNTRNSKRNLLCTSLWECDEWSSCINGIKTRICGDINSCEKDIVENIERVGCIQDLSGSLIGSDKEDKKSNLIEIFLSILILAILLIFYRILKEYY